MKKILTIALAALLALTAVSSFAIVDRGNDPSGKKVLFESVAISNNLAMADYSLQTVSAIADPAKTYVQNEMIFGVLKFNVNDNRPDELDSLQVRLVSDNCTFPTWLNTGTSASKTHFVDKNGVLQSMPYSWVSRTTAYTLPNLFTITQNNDEEFIVSLDNTIAVTVPAAAGTTTYATGYKGLQLERVLDDIIAEGGRTNGVQPLPKVTDNAAFDVYVGFNGIVKASTATQGIIKAYINYGGASKFSGAAELYWNYTASALQASPDSSRITDPTEWGVLAPASGKPADIVPFIDIFDGSTAKYRIFAIGYNHADKQAAEYFVQPYEGDELVKWGVGFQNDTNKKFRKITYREGMETGEPDAAIALKGGPATAQSGVGYTLYSVSSATAAANPLDPAVAATASVDQCWTDGSLHEGYLFFKIADQVTPGQLGPNVKAANQLDTKIKPIMDFFGFSLTYYNATRDSDYEVGGWKDVKEAKFNYFGAIVDVEDDDVIPAETGDASATIVIVLAGSALLAAAALFFVMKNARD